MGEPTNEEARTYAQTLMFDADDENMCSKFPGKEKEVFKLFHRYRIPMTVCVYAMHEDHGAIDAVEDFVSSYGSKTEIIQLVDVVEAGGGLAPIFPKTGIVNRFAKLVQEARRMSDAKDRKRKSREGQLGSNKKSKKDNDEDLESDSSSSDAEMHENDKLGLWLDIFKDGDTSNARRTKVFAHMDRIYREEKIRGWCAELESQLNGPIARWECPDRSSLKCIAHGISQGNVVYIPLKNINNCEATRDADVETHKKYRDNEHVEDTKFKSRKFGTKEDVRAAVRTLNMGRLILNHGLKIKIGRVNGQGEKEEQEYFDLETFRLYEQIFDEQMRPQVCRSLQDMLDLAAFVSDQANLMTLSNDVEYEGIWSHKTAIKWIKAHRSQFLMNFQMTLNKKKETAKHQGNRLSVESDTENANPGGGGSPAALATAKAKGVKKQPPKDTDKAGRKFTEEQMQIRHNKKMRKILKKKKLPIPAEFAAPPPDVKKVWPDKDRKDQRARKPPAKTVPESEIEDNRVVSQFANLSVSPEETSASACLKAGESSRDGWRTEGEKETMGKAPYLFGYWMQAVGACILESNSKDCDFRNCPAEHGICMIVDLKTNEACRRPIDDKHWPQLHIEENKDEIWNNPSKYKNKDGKQIPIPGTIGAINSANGWNYKPKKEDAQGTKGQKGKADGKGKGAKGKGPRKGAKGKGGEKGKGAGKSQPKGCAKGEYGNPRGPLTRVTDAEKAPGKRTEFSLPIFGFHDVSFSDEEILNSFTENEAKPNLNLVPQRKDVGACSSEEPPFMYQKDYADHPSDPEPSGDGNKEWEADGENEAGTLVDTSEVVPEVVTPEEVDDTAMPVWAPPEIPKVVEARPSMDGVEIKDEWWELTATAAVISTDHYDEFSKGKLRDETTGKVKQVKCNVFRTALSAELELGEKVISISKDGKDDSWEEVSVETDWGKVEWLRGEGLEFLHLEPACRELWSEIRYKKNQPKDRKRNKSNDMWNFPDRIGAVRKYVQQIVKDQKALRTIKEMVRNKILVYRDGKRLNFGHALVLIARGHTESHTVMQLINDRFEWEAANWIRRAVAHGQYKQSVMAKYDGITCAALAAVLKKFPKAKEMFQLPEHLQRKFEKCIAKMEDKGVISQMRRGRQFDLVDKTLDLKAFVKAAQEAPQPMQVLPRVDEDCLLGAFVAVLTANERKEERARRAELVQQIADIVERFYIKIEPERPISARRVGRCQKPMLMSVLGRLLGWKDTQVGFDSFWGMRLIGEFEDCKVMRKNFQTNLEKEPEDLMLDAKGFIIRNRNRILNQGGPAEGENILMEKTHIELDRNESCGPYTHKEMCAVFDQQPWKCMLRFVTWTAGKWREIDSGKASGHNRATRLQNRIICSNVEMADVFAKLYYHMWSSLDEEDRCKEFEITGGTEDLKRAYRQVAVAPEHLPYSVTMVSYCGKPRFVVVLSLVFGLSSAVMSFNRIARFLTGMLRRALAVCVDNYFDDFLQIEMKNGACQAKDLVYFVTRLMGWWLDPGKSVGPSILWKWLGVMKEVKGLKMISRICPKRMKKLTEQILKFLEPGEKMTPAQAATMAGKWQFAVSALFGKAGRISLRPIRRRQYEDHDEKGVITPAIEAALKWMLVLLEILPESVTHLDCSMRGVLTVFTDASSEETRNMKDPEYKQVLKELGVQYGRHVQLGWIAYEGATVVEAGYHVVCEKTLARWSKKQPIALGETLGAIMGVYYGVAGRTSMDIKLFVDNMASLSSIINGSSKDEANDELVQAFHLWMAAKDIRLWAEYVPSAANPADEPSRDGTVDGQKVDCKDIPAIFDAQNDIRATMVEMLKKDAGH